MITQNRLPIILEKYRKEVEKYVKNQVIRLSEWIFRGYSGCLVFKSGKNQVIAIDKTGFHIKLPTYFLHIT